MIILFSFGFFFIYFFVEAHALVLSNQFLYYSQDHWKLE